jgi:glutamyl-tRNA synthetase
MTVRVRIAPSPTGDPHVGTAYIALFNLIFARHHGGKFILRIEDTDQKRSSPEYEQNIFKALHWCGIQWDEGPDIGGDYGPYRQSERLKIYKECSQQLLDNHTAYKCFCTPQDLEEMRKKAAEQPGARQGYDRRCRDLSDAEVQRREQVGQSYVVRLKVPLSGECVWEDAIRGTITFPWADVDDQVLMKSDGFPTYHMGVVVDDYKMAITHVIRGDEWMSSTPKHILLYQAFGWKAPIFMHMPLLLGKDGKKLSKRRNPTSIFFFRDSGYLPEALMNFLTLMGYSMTEDREIYRLEDIIKEFDYKRIGVAGAIFDMQKLDWMNQQYLIKNIPQDQLWNKLKDWSFNDAFMNKLMPLCHERIKTFGDFIALFDFLFVNHLQYRKELFAIKEIPHEQLAYLLQGMIWHMDANEDWGSSGIHAASMAVSELFEVHHKKVVMPLLYASLMAKDHGPPLFDSTALLGKDRTRVRLLRAIEFLGGISNKKVDTLKKAWEKKECKALMDLPA